MGHVRSDYRIQNIADTKYIVDTSPAVGFGKRLFQL
ncbi:hypothetical protein EV213_101250 [Aureibacillus halotolerans]|uniref:Uncharacterized protein n=1 Tax=Aureibacillus halotolerans TaxID=1508390 RepID=A0A4R6U8T7_9BACI|nr:hypothetical protein EV213_101250 [Aureibacillus halotolerans]